MKILLCQDVEELGWLGDVVDVKDGYANNYLLPQGLGMVPTVGNLKSLAKEKAAGVERRKELTDRLSDAAKAVEGAEVVVAAKANEQGHLFGSVTAAEIASNLREQGFAIEDKQVRLGDHIKEVGETEVTIKFAAELTATVKVVVVAEQGQESESVETEE